MAHAGAHGCVERIVAAFIARGSMREWTRRACGGQTAAVHHEITAKMADVRIQNSDFRLAHLNSELCILTLPSSRYQPEGWPLRRSQPSLERAPARPSRPRPGQARQGRLRREPHAARRGVRAGRRAASASAGAAPPRDGAHRILRRRRRARPRGHRGHARAGSATRPGAARRTA